MSRDKPKDREEQGYWIIIDTVYPVIDNDDRLDFLSALAMKTLLHRWVYALTNDLRISRIREVELEEVRDTHEDPAAQLSKDMEDMTFLTRDQKRLIWRGIADNVSGVLDLAIKRVVEFYHGSERDWPE